MSQPELSKLVSKLAIKVLPKHRPFGNPEGLYGRLLKMRKCVTALVRHERVELRYYQADESRGYAERLISDAIRYGDRHKPTMEHAKFWLEDPALIPKLFKVLAPRYEKFAPGVPYTRLLRAPKNPSEMTFDYRPPDQFRAVLELRGNPYPPLPSPFAQPHPGQIHNVLLEEARKAYFNSQNELARRAETIVQTVPDDLSCDMEELDESEVDPAALAASEQSSLDATPGSSNPSSSSSKSS